MQEALDAWPTRQTNCIPILTEFYFNRTSLVRASFKVQQQTFHLDRLPETNDELSFRYSDKERLAYSRIPVARQTGTFFNALDGLLNLGFWPECRSNTKQHPERDERDRGVLRAGFHYQSA
ncbi:hypothetical protein [Polaromonas sp. P5_D5]